MSVSIKVAVRVRPFTCKSPLGVNMVQNSEESGEVQLLKSKYSTNRFAFSWAWWTAFNYKKYLTQDDKHYGMAEDMKIATQPMVYAAVGKKVKAELYEGNAIVLFAYGLSGSGKTFTVFGPDAPDAPEAWFKHMEPYDMWGVFPNLAYEIFADRKDGWKIVMKYFQNVVDTIRDLMSPVGREQNYKQGMRKDKDGFTDVEWCIATPLASWKQLCEIFQEANGRKAIAPTQFNPMSTRGHCIMTLEVEKPDPSNAAMKQKGRVYVCDLAGTEPAGDVVYARYKKVKAKDAKGNESFEYVFQGAHADANKTKQLQDQGKKINLSLTEMAQFFMKMAQAIKRKKLKPGSSIPGCNSYFLCKYLKDTMMQARTYLFCAIRPEVKFQNYTFSTCGFAKNASVIKLTPKKATVAASPKERKMMAEMQKMQAMMKKMEEDHKKMLAKGGGGGGSSSDAEVEKLKKMLAEKSQALNAQLSSEGGSSAADEEAKMMARQKDEYARRGIDLAHFSKDVKEPYFVNLDEDGFRNGRFYYIMRKDITKFGPGGDITPMSFAIVADHCSVEKKGKTLTLTGGKGETYVNGKVVLDGKKVKLKPFDRVVLASSMCLYRHPGVEPKDKEPPSADDAAEEYREAIRKKNASQQAAFQDQLKAFEDEKAKFNKQRGDTGGKTASADKIKAAKEAIHQELLDLVPKIKEMTSILKLLHRSFLVCEATMQDSLSTDFTGVPIVKVKIVNQSSGEQIVLDPFEFVKAHTVLNDEVAFIKGALAAHNDYVAPDYHEPVQLLFDHSFQLGTAIFFIEYLIYLFPSEDEDTEQAISNVVSPHQDVGKLEVSWVPLADEEDDGTKDIPEVGDPSELIGKPWTYMIKITSASQLNQMCKSAYCQYEFNGETFTTETIESETKAPKFKYEFVHHVDSVTQEFIDWLQKPFHINVFVTPYVSNPPHDKISSNNEAIVANITGKKPSLEGKAAEIRSLKKQLAALQKERDQLAKENKELKAKLGGKKKK